MPLILDLCGGTGAWSAPYRAAGYDVCLITLPDKDVRCFDKQKLSRFRGRVRGVLAAPPCTEFAVSGARWWKDKPPHLLADAIDVVRACLEIIRIVEPVWWALENPAGRIAKCVPELGQQRFIFDPCDFGDPYTKRTYLWGRFNEPCKAPVEPVLNVLNGWHSQDLLLGRRRGSSPIHRCPPGPKRQEMRSMTPPGFARAFFEANP